MKIKKKCHFRGQNDGILPKKDDPPVESYSLTHCQSKGCTNLWESEFWCKKMSTKMKIFQKKCHVIDRNDRIWPKNDKPFMESCSLTHFQSKNCTNLCQFEFWRKKKNEQQNETFEKNTISEAETMEFGRKMMSILWSPTS